MREPDLHTDGWCLDDGEMLHQEAPGTFLIPPRELRDTLQPGDYAKLVFRIAVEGGSTAWERMWVIVRKCIVGGYLGVLDNDPDAIQKNDKFWSGIELPFQSRHIIDARPGDTASQAIAIAEPRRRWR